MSAPLRSVMVFAIPFTLLVFSSHAQAVERHVGPGQTYATISAAVAASLAGDIITVHDAGGTPDYREAITLNVRGLTLR